MFSTRTLLTTLQIIGTRLAPSQVLTMKTLLEAAEKWKVMLVARHLALDSRLRNVIFSDGDAVEHVKLSSVPYASEMKHFICCFYLSDMNVKKEFNRSSHLYLAEYILIFMQRGFYRNERMARCAQ